ncbi:hypothetical protein D3C80_1973740 [compost metagenome]
MFDLDIEHLKKNVQINTPTSLYLNFFQHLGIQYENAKGNIKDIYLDKYQRIYLDWLEEQLEVPITHLGTGEEFGSFIKIKKLK